MNAPFSAYLSGIRGGVQELVRLLRMKYDYVSVLATDSCGFAVRISQRSRSVSSETMTTERGLVVRVCRERQYSEVALNHFDASSPASVAAEVEKAVEQQRSLLASVGTQSYFTPLLPDEPLVLFAEKECEILPEQTDLKELVDWLTEAHAVFAQGENKAIGSAQQMVVSPCIHIYCSIKQYANLVPNFIVGWKDDS